jgi:hypothetical protein
LRLADVDGDGRLDLAVAFSNFDKISVLLGDGAGSFAPGASYPTVVQAQVSAIAAADLDGDGHTDLVTANQNPIGNTVGVLLGGGLVPYGIGTGGCDGVLGITGGKPPRLGQAGFGVNVTNAPRRAAGTMLLGLVPDLLGRTLPFLQLRLHVDLGVPAISMAMATDGAGTGFVPLPIPPNASLVGARLYPQAVLAESPLSGRACSPAFGRLVASRGLALAVLP